MAFTQIEDEVGRFNDEECIDMETTRLGVKVVRPTEEVKTVQQDTRSTAVVAEFIDPKTMSGDDYDLPCSD